MDKPEKLKLKTEDLTNENVEKLGSLFPDILTEVKKDGKTIKTIDVEKLKELVGNFADKDSEIYQLTWAGKQNARRVATEPTTNTLRPVIADSVDFENTENLYIEGDNLEVLKILRKSYTNSIKAIYIDPPYNTRKDFVYKDNFSMSKEDYEAEAGAVDEEGNRLIKNTGTDGRFHSNWLNMMYPRLQLAYKLLKKDGVIFISIDDNEVDNLKKACDEIFGETNFIANIIWRSKSGGANDSKHVAIDHEYILVYSKNFEECNLGTIEYGDELLKLYNARDDKYKEYGPYRPMLLMQKGLSFSASLTYPIIAPDGTELRPDEGGAIWRWSEKRFKQKLEEGFIEFKQVGGEWKVYTKQYLNVDYDGNRVDRGKLLRSVIIDCDGRDGTRDLQKLFDGKIFNNPKSVKLISLFAKIGLTKDDTVLDFFSGSATTAHAVMQLNAEDNGSRKFIMVQLPEEVEEGTEAFKAGYKNICEIGKERIRRAAKKIQEENKDKDLSNVDFGFRVFKLDESNMKDTFYNPGLIDQKTLTNFKDSIKEDRTEEDLIYQVLLDMGIPISANIEIKTIQNKKVFVVNDGWLVGCFDNEIELDLIKELAEIKSEINGLKTKFVFRESSFKNDSAMINAMEYLKTKVFKTDAELKSNVKVI